MSKPNTNQKFFIDIVEEKQRSLEEFLKELAEITDSNKSFTEKVTLQIEEIETLLANTNIQLQKNPDDDFFTRQHIVLKESEQVLKDIQRSQDDIHSLLTSIVSHLKHFWKIRTLNHLRKKTSLTNVHITHLMIYNYYTIIF